MGRVNLDIRNFPGYANAKPVEEVDASQLSEHDFERNYWSQNKPCVLKGAASHWSAISKWTSLDYVREQLAAHGSLEEMPTIYYQEVQSEFSEGQAPPTEASLAEFFEILEKGEESAWMRAAPLGVQPQHPKWKKTATAMNALFDQDTGDILFQGKAAAGSVFRAPPRQYPRLRMFFYVNSLTDWHPHHVDAHLTVQAKGSKRFLLAPPNNSLKVLLPLMENSRFIGNAEPHDYDALEPYEVVLDAGDVVFIPIYWAHAVQSVDATPGVTMAYTFRCPWHVHGDARIKWNAIKDVSPAIARLRLLARLGYTFSKSRYPHFID